MRASTSYLTRGLRSIAVFVLALPLLAAVPAQPPPLDPQPLPPIGDCVLDNIYYGAVPPNSEDRPVLVFVPGLSGLALDWWTDTTSAGMNDMAVLAYAAGYRTAYVNVNVAPLARRNCEVQRRPGNDWMNNGRVLSIQLDAITQHFGVEQVDIIAHSKGGVDSQAAVLYWGAGPQIRRIFTLATPHNGTALADLLYDNAPIGLWLRLLLNPDDGTFSMRVGSMGLFRAFADQSPLDDAICFYSGSGRAWNSPGTIFSLSGEWLQQQAPPIGGDNDGVVTVASSQLTGSKELFVQPWNHYEVMLGHNAFPYIEQVLLNEPCEVQAPPPPPVFRTFLPPVVAAALLEGRSASK